MFNPLSKKKHWNIFHYRHYRQFDQEPAIVFHIYRVKENFQQNNRRKGLVLNAAQKHNDI